MNTVFAGVASRTHRLPHRLLHLTTLAAMTVVSLCSLIGCQKGPSQTPQYLPITAWQLADPEGTWNIDVTYGHMLKESDPKPVLKNETVMTGIFKMMKACEETLVDDEKIAINVIIQDKAPRYRVAELPDDSTGLTRCLVEELQNIDSDLSLPPGSGRFEIKLTMLNKQKNPSANAAGIENPADLDPRSNDSTGGIE